MSSFNMHITNTYNGYLDTQINFQIFGDQFKNLVVILIFFIIITIVYTELLFCKKIINMKSDERQVD